jgi:hypothetical protein
MESNPPSARHWLYRVFEVDRPTTHRIFKQPPAVLYDASANDGAGEYSPNPEAENIDNLPGGYDYYMRALESSTRDFISVYYMGEYGMSFSGKPVYSQFSQSVHVAKTKLSVIPSQPVIVGMDFGLQSACVFTQLSMTGALIVLDEISPQDCTLEEFITAHVLPKRAARFPSSSLMFVGDPAGNQRSSLNIKTAFDIVKSFGIAARPAHTNDVLPRVQSIAHFLNRRGGMFIDPSCVNLIEALSGGYRYAKRRTGDVKTEYQDKPEKNDASHICFPAGTIVATEHGDTPIESLVERVTAGVRVHTPFGLREVEWAEQTSVSAELLELTFSDGGTLQCTKDHPIWVRDKGLARADELQYGDTVVHQGDSICQALLAFKALGFIKTQNKDTGSGILSLRPRRTYTCTEKFGSTITGLFLWASKFTTSITTKTITIFQTLTAWTEPLMPHTTCGYDMRLESYPVLLSSRYNEPPRGTVAKKGSLGTDNTLQGLGSRETNQTIRASSAGQSLNGTLEPTNAGSVLPRVSPPPDVTQESITSQSIARTAGATKQEVSIPSLSHAQRRVVSGITRVENAPVYSIKVREVGLHYANGVLVSNCDAAQYAALYHRHGVGARVVKTKAAPTKKFLYA